MLQSAGGIRKLKLETDASALQPRIRYHSNGIINIDLFPIMFGYYFDRIWIPRRRTQLDYVYNLNVKLHLVGINQPEWTNFWPKCSTPGNQWDSCLNLIENREEEIFELTSLDATTVIRTRDAFELGNGIRNLINDWEVLIQLSRKFAFQILWTLITENQEINIIFEFNFN